MLTALTVGASTSVVRLTAAAAAAAGLAIVERLAMICFRESTANNAERSLSPRMVSHLPLPPHSLSRRSAAKDRVLCSPQF